MDSIAFFNRLYSGFSSGKLTICSPNPGIGNKTWSVFWFDITDLGAAAAYAQQLATERNVYFGIGVRREELPRGKRGEVGDVIGLPGFWIDVDYHADYRKAGRAVPLPPDENACFELFGALPGDLLPTLLVRSGSGLHGWWLFDEPLLVDDDNREFVKEKSVWIQKFVQDEGKRRGWHVDRTADLARVLRIPGTPNHNAKRMVEVVPDFFGPILTAQKFARRANSTPPLLSLVPPPSAAPSAIQAPNPSTEHLRKQPRRQLAPGQSVLDYTRSCMARSGKPETKLLLDGKPFANEGGRNNTVYALVSQALYFAVEVDPDVSSVTLLPIFEPSIAAMAKEQNDPSNPALDISTVEQMLTRSLASVLAKRETEWAAEDQVKRALAQQAFALPTTRSFRERIANRTDEEKAQGYTQEDKEFFAKEQGCSIEEWRRRWIIQCGSTYWVWLNGRYSSPVPQSSIESIVRDHLTLANLDLWTPKAKGDGLRKKKLNEILDDYSTSAFRVESSLVLQNSRFDGQVFHEAVCPVRDLEPLETPEISKWLSLIGSDEVDRLLDWIATLTFLHSPSCGLYIHGPKGCGKGMFGEGLARLWTTTGSATRLAEIIGGSFNEGLASCPLIWADEGLPSSRMKVNISDELRTLVTDTVRPLNRKYLARTALHGSIRLLLTANNDSMLTSQIENPTDEDSQALAERFLYIRCSDAAAKYLVSIGGRRTTDAWVAGDLLARHALWLRDTRKVIPGSRLLVTGRESKMLSNISTGFGINGAICDWLVQYIERPNLVRSIVGNQALCGNGRLLVTTRALCDSWQQYVKYREVPTTTLMGRQLASLSKTDRGRRLRIKNQRAIYHDIKTKLLFDWAERTNVGDIEFLKKRIEEKDDSWTVDEVEEIA